MNSTGLTINRRHALRSLVGGSLLFPGILADLLADSTVNPPVAATLQDALSPKPPHHHAKAKRVIFLYMSGGVSHVDSFDPKPDLFARHGTKLEAGYLKRPNWPFRARGKCGTEVSDLFPQMGACMDDICLIRSLHGDHGNHFEATLGIHTGSVTVTRPSIGSWVTYGLGTSNQNLPAFVVIAPYLPYAGAHVWSSDFLPGCYQGVRIIPGNEPIPNLKSPLPRDAQQRELEFIQSLNRDHQRKRPGDPLLETRIRTFETAFGMQMAAPEVFDIAAESDATLDLYGITRETRLGFGWQCLVARRLAERGVRFIELIDSGASSNWDSHADMADHGRLAQKVDRAIGGLLRDLKGRGMLEDTLVVWTTEFGRTPFVSKPDALGREHHAAAYCSWLAGAGVKPGIAFGKTDDHAIKVVADEVHVHDFHATILHLLGLDHERLTFRHAGRDFRLTDVSGRVVQEILA